MINQVVSNLSPQAVLEAATRLGQQVAAEKRSRTGFIFRGAALELQTCSAPEVVISGPSETGKTVAVLTKLDHICRQYPGAQITILRKVFETVAGTVQQSYEKRIIGGDPSIRRFGGEKAAWYDYPNGARMWMGGMDNADKVLGGERDIIFANQAEQFSLNDWEYLTTRATGRAGNIPHPQVIGDCNPAGAMHWILTRPRLVLLHSVHRDNPALYDDAGELTEQGRRTLETLTALTGARKLRLFLGLWAQAEGVVYGEEFGEENLTEDEPDASLSIELAADDGYYPDPRVILFIQKTPTRILIFDEMYHIRHLAEVCVNETVRRCGDRFGWRWLDDQGKPVDAPEDEKAALAALAAKWSKLPLKLPDICVGGTESKELQGRFRLANIPYRGGTHSPITEGIEVVRRLIQDANGYRLIKVHKRCTNLISEMTDGYRYPDADAKRSKLDVPVDENNHGPDALRVWAWVRARR